MSGNETMRTRRLPVLDGWRAISVLLVLAAHLLPLGPSPWKLNSAAGLLAMSIFFCLSGFLIVSQLLADPSAYPFFVKRIFRIVPLVVLFVIVAFPVWQAQPMQYVAHLAFTQNYLHQYIMPITTHFWSLCVEIHFYVAIGLLAALAGRRGIWLIPVLYLALVANKVAHGVPQAITTQYRVDEILAGGLLAMLHGGMLPGVVRSFIVRIPLVVWLGCSVLAAHSLFPGLMYVRSLFVCGLVGHTIWTDQPAKWRFLKCQPMAYIATISYAVYVWHGFYRHGLLDSPDKVVRYLKRPLIFLATFATAHLSTFYFEMPINRWARRTLLRSQKPRAATAHQYS